MFHLSKKMLVLLFHTCPLIFNVSVAVLKLIHCLLKLSLSVVQTEKDLYNFFFFNGKNMVDSESGAVVRFQALVSALLFSN